ncbi:MAG TPA: MXAN_5187 family protein, partial [Polyangiaceae bacterium]
MLLSRFWYVVLALLLGSAAFVLDLAKSMYNRAGSRDMGERLSSDSQLVGWYLRNDARERSAQLINFAVDKDIAKYLHDASAAEAKVPEEAKDKLQSALSRVNQKIPADAAFDAVFAVDQHGRVVARMGYEQAAGMEDFELGGYPVVADALHGFLRDDTLVLDRIYRVVARPVEFDLGQLPAGAIVGARIIDDRFARELSSRANAAVAFYANAQRVASGAPEGFDKSQLDSIVNDLDSLKSDEEYASKGRSKPRIIGKQFGVQYSLLHGEAWELGAGYAVARIPPHVDGPLDFFNKADDKDKETANVFLAVLVALAAAAAGLLFSVFEHSRPLYIFRSEAIKLAKGQLDQLHPSRFRGIFRKIASDLNDGIDQVAAKGGVPRRAADLKQVLGDIPDQPQMSAFSLPGEGTAPAAAAPSSPGLPPPSQPRVLPSAPRASEPMSPAGPASPGVPAAPPSPGLPRPPPRRGLPTPPTPRGAQAAS